MPTLGFLQRHKVQKQQALARLAASDTAGLLSRAVEQTSAADRQAALARLRRAFLGAQAPDDVAEDLLDLLVAHLRASEANINFPAYKFFYNKKIREKYTTQFETAGWGGAAYMVTRNEVEEKMFHYGDGVGAARGAAPPGERAAAQRVRALGTSDSDQFAGSIRPRYCSINYPRVRDGMGAQWGRSHLVLAERLKPNMTFVSSDSFDLVSPRTTPTAAQAQVATYTNLTRLVRYMPDRMLDALHDAALDQLAPKLTHAEFAKKYGLGNTAYVEAHLHAELYFARDVQKLRVAAEEVYNCEALYAKAKWEPITPRQLKQNIERFSDKLGVSVVWFE